MGRPHISAKSKKEPIPYDKENIRLRALFPDHKSSKAEKNFWSIVAEDCKKKVNKTPIIKNEDFIFIDKLDIQYWKLQDEIDNENTDVAIVQSCIQQQHDILDEQEKIYQKYLPNEKAKNK